MNTPHMDPCSLDPFVKDTAGVIMDGDFKLDKQINSVEKSSFFQLRLLSEVKPFFIFKRL